MRVCLVYDCLHPWTIGGAERWMRNVADALADEGHEVTYLTRRQWPADEPPHIPGVRVVAVSREEPLYGPDGNRTIGEPLRFGAGVLGHLLRHGAEYDVVHTASFPYFSLLAAAAARRLHRYRLVVDWHEVWSDEYWKSYLGPAKAPVAREIQRACVRVPQHAFCVSELNATRLRALGLRSRPTVIRGLIEHVDASEDPPPARPHVVFAGRLIAEKQAPRVVSAVMEARRRLPELTGTIFGDGPQLAAVREAIEAAGAGDVIEAPGFVDAERVARTLRESLCLLLPSIREGYGVIVVEASAVGVPTVLVRAPDNAATEHIEPGVNGYVAESADPSDLAEQILAVHDGGAALRRSTADWYQRHAEQLDVRTSVRRVLESYGRDR